MVGAVVDMMVGRMTLRVGVCMDSRAGLGGKSCRGELLLTEPILLLLCGLSGNKALAGSGELVLVGLHMSSDCDRMSTLLVPALESCSCSVSSTAVELS